MCSEVVVKTEVGSYQAFVETEEEKEGEHIE